MDLSSFSLTEDREWLVTNGLGGYASSTITGLNTRKYHGLLVGAFSTEDRRVLLSKIDEEVVIDGVAYQLGANQYWDTVEPDGFKYQKSFSLNPHPSFVYELPGTKIAKTVFMPQGSNAVVVRYDIHAKKPVEFNANFLTTSRDFHWVLRDPEWDYSFERDLDLVSLTPGHEKPPILCLGTTAGTIKKPSFGDNRLRGLYYRKEMERGYPCIDDLYIGARLEAPIAKSQRLYVVCAADPLKSAAKSLCKGLLKAPADAEEKEVARKEALSKQFCKSKGLAESKALSMLAISADSFIVKKGSLNAIIAGYPWFGEWGRDSLISLPGLCLSMRRKDEAEKILQNLVSEMEAGFLPNHFMGKKSFDSIDTSLWLFWTVWKYIEYTKDYKFVKAKLWPSMKKIIAKYASIADSDGLIKTASDTPMTWMDAVVNGVPASLRKGKAVEVQALWFNALMVSSELAKEFKEDPTGYKKAADYGFKRFNSIFFNPANGYLFDAIDGNAKDASVRPNALFAISLPFPILERPKWKGVVDLALKELKTPHGLRTLSRSDKRYRGVAYGNIEERDTAYHNGDSWPWLMGAFIDAYCKAYPERPVGHLINPLIEEAIGHRGIGHISEVYDGSPPQSPEGCISQAWSVAEAIRALSENLQRL